MEKKFNKEEILENYLKGFRDELRGSTSSPEGELNIKAYKVGASHALLGDDCKHFDELTIDEILKEIHNYES